MKIKTGIGQDSHRFENSITNKICMIGGVEFENIPALLGNSDADVVLHAITNAISGVTGVNILGEVADEMCSRGITESSEYVKEALKNLGDFEISNISISIECKKPKITPRITEMKYKISELLSISSEDIGITATTGEKLTSFGKSKGIQSFAIITVVKK
jgi:2-C-methyl-D-erythritol 2,4-cyclodiphosphate synthase